MQHCFRLDVVVQEGAAVYELLAGKKEPLQAGWDALLRLNLDAQIIDQAVAFHVERESPGAHVL